MALEDLSHLVIDEADRMVQPGRFEVRSCDRWRGIRPST